MGQNFRLFIFYIPQEYSIFTLEQFHLRYGCSYLGQSVRFFIFYIPQECSIFTLMQFHDISILYNLFCLLNTVQYFSPELLDSFPLIFNLWKCNRFCSSEYGPYGPANVMLFHNLMTKFFSDACDCTTDIYFFFLDT